MGMPLFYKPRIRNIIFGFSLIFLSAVFNSLNIFSVPIEAVQPRLTSIWSQGMALGFIVSSFGTFITTPYLKVNKFRSTAGSSCTRQLTRMSLVMASMYCFIMLAVPAIEYASSVVLYVSIIPQGLSNSFFYLVGMNALITWLPKNPGIAFFMSTLACSSSQYIITPILHMAISRFGVESSLIVSPLFMFLISLLLGMFLRFPTENEEILLKQTTLQDIDKIRDIEYSKIVDEESNSPQIYNSEMDENCRWQSLLRMSKFYHFMALIFVGRTSSALIPYYFKIGDIFDVDADVIVYAFQILSVGSAVWMFLVSAFYEHLSRAIGPSVLPPFIVTTFLIQGGLYFALVHVSADGYQRPVLALVFLSATIAVMETHKLFNVIWAYQFFGSRNAMFVYGLAGGLSVGPAGTLFTLLLTSTETMARKNGAVITSESYTPFYYFAATCCIFGAVLGHIT